MSPAENVATLPQPQTGSYEFARFNALQHGVLSRHTVLPWENPEEYRVLLEALVAEHKPLGPTEEHLVEELAGIIWRKRRLRLGESAAYHRALKRSTYPFRETAKAAVIHLSSDDKDQFISEAIIATDEETAKDHIDLATDQAMTEKALCLLDRPSKSAYSRALAELREDTREWWEEQLKWEPDDYDEDQTPYRADAENLKRFLQTEVAAWYDKRRQELYYRPLLRAQAFGEAVDPDRLERLARYEVHLDRKLERMLTMLFKLQELRRVANPV